MSTIFAGAGSLILSGVVTAAIMFFEANRTTMNKVNRRRKRVQSALASAAPNIVADRIAPDRTVMDKAQDIYSEQRNNLKTILGKNSEDLKRIKTMVGEKNMSRLRTLGKELGAKSKKNRVNRSKKKLKKNSKKKTRRR
jgi:hypothetical protein